MARARTKGEARFRRKMRIRTKVNGTVERPRLTVFRSSRHIYAQVVNDDANSVLATAGTLGKEGLAELQGLNKIDQAKKIGARIAAHCLSKGIDKVVFDRNGYKYHGRVMALANAAREAGLKL